MDAVVQGCSVKEVFFKNSQNLQGNTCAEACNVINKETPAQMFSYVFCEISKKSFFIENLWPTNSVGELRQAN